MLKIEKLTYCFKVGLDTFLPTPSKIASDFLVITNLAILIYAVNIKMKIRVRKDISEVLEMELQVILFLFSWWCAWPNN